MGTTNIFIIITKSPGKKKLYKNFETLDYCVTFVVY